MLSDRLKKQMIKITGSTYLMTFIPVILIAAGFILSGTSEAALKLKKPIPELCYECHEDLKQALSDTYQHALFKKGDCISCHNSHASTVPGLLDDSVDSVCLDCHESLRIRLKSERVHNALRDSRCSTCHEAHSGNHEHLLVSSENDLCISCHEAVKEKSDLTFGCRPFKQGSCSSCHNSHASPGANLLTSEPNGLCRECHAPRCKAGDVSVSRIVQDSDCTSCHSGHGSQNRSALGPFGHSAFIKGECDKCHPSIAEGIAVTTILKNEALCFMCHKKDDYTYVDDKFHENILANRCNLCHSPHASDNANLTVNERDACITCHEGTEKNTQEMERNLKTVECEPVKDRACFACHLPGHSEEPLGNRGDGIAMCVRCHTSEHSSTHPVGNDIIDPRNNGPVTCISCHSMHESRFDFMLTHDRNRTLCIQCHRNK